MSTAHEMVVEQAHDLVRSARMLPAGEAAKVLEQALTVLRAAQHDVLGPNPRPDS